MQNFTSNDLLLYYFNELPLSERQSLELELSKKQALYGEYINLKHSLSLFDDFALAQHPKLANYIIEQIHDHEASLPA